MNEVENAFENDVINKDLGFSLKDYSNKIKGNTIDLFPSLSVLNKIKNLFVGIQEYVMMKKVCSFLFELSKMPLESRVHLVDKINEDPIYGQKFSEFLIVAIDRHEFHNKSIMLARVCKYYEMGILSKSTFIRFKGLIEQLDIEDLESLKYAGYDYFGYPYRGNDISLFRFQSMGLTRVKKQSEMKMYSKDHFPSFGHDYDKIHVELTDFGKVFIMVINDYPDPWFMREGFIM